MTSQRSTGWATGSLLVVLCSLAGSGNAGPPVSRQVFQQRLKQIAASLQLPADPARLPAGMPSARVLRILGPPDEVRPWSEFVPEGEQPHKVWCYGVVSPGGFPTLGRVVIGNRGLAGFVYGGQGIWPALPSIPEGKLRHLLDLLDRVPGPQDGAQADPMALIQAVNELQPLGKERALEVIREYVRLNVALTSPGSAANDCPYGLYPLLCLLFSVDPKHEEHFLKPNLLVQDEVPFTPFSGGGGSPGIQVGEEELENFSRFGKIRPKPLRPPQRPWEILTQLEAIDLWPKDDSSRLYFRKQMAGQLLWLLRPVYRTPLDKHGIQLPPDKKFNEWWDGIVADLVQLNIHWDSRKDSYVFANGSQLPQETLPEHRGPIR